MVKEEEKHSNAKDGIKLEIRNIKKHHIVIKEINFKGEDRNNTKNEENDYIKNNVKYQFQDKKEFFYIKDRTMEHNVK